MSRILGKFMRTSWTKKLLMEFVVPVSVLVLLAYGLVFTGVLRVRVFPYPHDVLCSGLSTLSSHNVHQAIGITLGRLALSFLIALGIGSALALVSHHSRKIEQVLALPVDVVRSIPIVTLFPVFIALWGFTRPPTWLFRSSSVLAFSTFT